MHTDDLRRIVVRLRRAGHAITIARDGVVMTGPDAFHTLDQFLRELWRIRERERAA